VTASRSLPRSLAAALALASAAAVPSAAEAFSPFLVVPDPAVAEASPAYRYANMTDGEALAELDRRHVLYQRLDSVPGVRAPIRLTGRLHGVYVHSSLPPEQRVTSMFEILDARLGLALDDFCAVLERHDIDEVVHFTMYRPNVGAPDHGPHDEQAASPSPTGARPRPAAHAAARPAPPPPARGAPSLGKGTLDAGKGRAEPHAMKRKGDGGGAGKPEARPIAAPAGKKAHRRHEAGAAHGAIARAGAAHGAIAGARAHGAIARAAAVVAVRQVAKRDAGSTGLHQTTWAAPGTRHPAGLAIDVGLLHKRDGRWLNVARDFHGKIGNKTCGEGAPQPESADGRELRALVCESADLGVFTYVLTPDYNAAHADHFHMEIKPGVKWFLYH